MKLAELMQKIATDDEHEEQTVTAATNVFEDSQLKTCGAVARVTVQDLVSALAQQGALSHDSHCCCCQVFRVRATPPVKALVATCIDESRILVSKAKAEKACEFVVGRHV